MNKPEKRFIDFTITKAETRNEGKEKKYIIEGVAAVVNKTADLGWFEEIILPGAFDGVLDDEDTVCLINHESSLVMARNKSTMELFITDDGNLGYRCEFPNTSIGQHYYNAIQRGDIRKSSFGFTVDREGHTWSWAQEPGQKDLRTISKIKRLYDVSPVTYPAYADTKVEARSIWEAAKAEKPQAEVPKPSLRSLEVEAVINRNRIAP
jgi:uncharacterized protein